jgi:DNA processing protein
MSALLGRMVHAGEPEYPTQLLRLAHPPPSLNVQGSLAGLERAVGIVGTRRATPAALAFTFELARALAERRVLVVSGGAEGVDRAAHEGALGAKDGRTLAVLPTALRAPFPAAHAPLFSEIATRGARLTEHTDVTRAYPAQFLERNRIIAALSHAVVIVQAPWRSGALRTASDARTLEIPVLVVPWSPNEPEAAGGLELLAKGARLCRHAEDVLTALGDTSAPPQSRRARAPQLELLLDDDQRAVLALLDDAAIDREALLGRLVLPAARAQAALARLVIDGLAHEDARGIRRLRAGGETPSRGATGRTRR